MTDKPNCSTCPLPKNMRSRYGMNCETLGENIEPDTVEKCGCLTHPGAREWLMKDVIVELERLSNQNVGSQYKYALTEAISLIRGEK